MTNVARKRLQNFRIYFKLAVPDFGRHRRTFAWADVSAKKAPEKHQHLAAHVDRRNTKRLITYKNRLEKRRS
jgi:hypothetical protein